MFYAHLIETTKLHDALDRDDLSDHERKELVLIAESGLHNAIIDTILTELVEDSKKTFLNLLHSDDHNEIWKFLETEFMSHGQDSQQDKPVDKSPQKKSSDKNRLEIEEKIKETAHNFFSSLHEDIVKLNLKSLLK